MHITKSMLPFQKKYYMEMFSSIFNFQLVYFLSWQFSKLEKCLFLFSRKAESTERGRCSKNSRRVPSFFVCWCKYTFKCIYSSKCVHHDCFCTLVRRFSHFALKCSGHTCTGDTIWWFFGVLYHINNTFFYFSPAAQFNSANDAYSPGFR